MLTDEQRCRCSYVSYLECLYWLRATTLIAFNAFLYSSVSIVIIPNNKHLQKLIYLTEKSRLEVLDYMKKDSFTLTDTDKEKIEKITDILPEREFTSYFLDSLSANAEYPTEYNERVTRALELSKGVFSKFDNDNINSKHLLFTTELSKLYSFLLSHFFTDTSGYYEDHARLYPEWRHPDEDKERKWLEKYNELQVLVSNTEQAYRDLLLTAKAELQQKETKIAYKITNTPEEEEVRAGPLSYKSGVLYHNGSRIDHLAPQAITLAKLFLYTPDTFISYKTIQEELSKGDYLSEGNMQKIISKLRRNLHKVTGKNLIKNVSGEGYFFEANKLL